MNVPRFRIIPAFLSVLCLLAPVLAQDELAPSQDRLREPTQEEMITDILETVEEMSVELSALRKEVDERFSKIDERFNKIEDNMGKDFDRIQDRMDAGFALLHQRFDLVEDTARNEATSWALRAFIPASLLGGFIGAAAVWFSQRRSK